MEKGTDLMLTRRSALACIMTASQAALGSCVSTRDGERPSHIALVIGVSYRSSRNSGAILPNTTADGALVARAFGEALPDPRQVIELYDPQFDALERTVDLACASLDNNSIAFVYYAGHGVQIGTENYIVTDDMSTLVNMNSIIESCHAAARGVVFILDACRNNPFARAGSTTRQLQMISGPVGQRSLATVPVSQAALTSGLARVNIPGAEIMVAFSTDPGDVADDAAYPGAVNGPFAAAFAEQLTKSSDIAQALTGTASALANRAHSQPGARMQTPWVQSSWTQAILLASGQAELLPPP